MIARAKVALHSPDALRRLFHFILAKTLFTLPSSARKTIFSGWQNYCPVCDTRLSRFLILHRPYNLWCPVCRSLQRHRLLWLFLNKTQLISQNRHQRLLHFAPEPCLVQRLASIPHLNYVSADLTDPSAMFRMNITQIQFPDNSFDIILCSHVLEHIPDDHKALSELYRVLKPEGQAVILVPINTKITYEDTSITDPIKREKLFGQLDHVRRYGPDFERRLEQAGFKTRITFTEDIVEPNEIGRMGLAKREIFFLGRKES